MDDLEKLYTELFKMPAPKGFAKLAEDLDIFVYQYADNIMGYANSFLAGKKIDPKSIHLDVDLDRKLDECAVKLNELKLFKRKYDTLTRLLLGNLLKDASK
jgi:hypothetical protein